MAGARLLFICCAFSASVMRDDQVGGALGGRVGRVEVDRSRARRRGGSRPRAGRR